jgi:hypothetical protein
MIYLLVIISILFSILIYLLLAPFYIEVNSLNNLYRIRFHRLMSLSIKNNNNVIEFEMKLFFWTRKINFSEAKTSEYKESKPKDNYPTKKNVLDWSKMKNVLKSFKLNSFDISVDTGNMQLNGILYPLVYFISIHYKKQIAINFSGQNYMILEIENNLARIICAYIKH